MRVRRGNATEERDIQPGDHFAAEMDHMSECVMDGKAVLPPGEEGLPGLWANQAGNLEAYPTSIAVDSVLRKFVSYNGAALHDELHVLQQTDVTRRVAGCGDYVSESSGCKLANAIGPAHEFGGVDGR